MNLWTAVQPFPAAGVGVASSINPTGIVVVPMPSVITAGDLLILSVSHHGTNWLTPPTDFTWELGGQVLSGAIRCEVYYRRATGAEGATTTVLCPQAPVAAGQVNSLRGAVASGTPLLSVITQANASGVTGCAQLTGLPEHALIYASVGFQVSSFINPSNSFQNGSDDPTGYGNFTNASATGSSDLYGNATTGLAIRAGEVLLAGDTGAFTWTQTVATNNAVVILTFEAEPLPPTAPPNAQPTTATEFTTLPDDVMQSVHDLGVTYAVWFKYTAVDGDNVIGFWAKGQDYVTYQPTTWVYDGIDNVIDGFAFILTGAAGSGNVLPVMVQVTPGHTYYFEIRPNSGNPTPATLSVNIQRFTDTTAPIGSIVVPGDSDGDTLFPLAVISGTTNQLIHQFRQNYTHGESADILLSGNALIYNLDTDTVDRTDTQLDLIQAHADVPIASVNIRYIRTCVGTNRWWVALGVGGTAMSACYMNEDGTTGAVHSIASVGGLFSAIAVSNDESILYYKLGGFSAVKRVDLLTDTVTSDLVAANGSFRINDMLVLADDSIVVLYNTAVGNNVQIKIYNPAGATLQTIALGTAWTFPFGFAPRLAQAIDPTQFWFWGISNSSSPLGQAIFYRIDAATGTILQTEISTNYQFGVSKNGEIDPPTNRYGISSSCPFWVARVAIAGPPTGGTIVVIKIVDPTSNPTSFSFNAGGGLTPTSFTLQHGDSQTFIDVPAGSGYSIVEATAAGFDTVIGVSNGSPNTNITVGEGETVTVTVTNTSTPITPAEGCPGDSGNRISGYPRFE